MKVIKTNTSKELGAAAAKLAAEKINEAVSKNGKARIVLSTGASQFDTLEALCRENVDWSKVEMFHLDEYVGISEEHPASFRKYLKERFVNIVNPGKVYFVDGNNPKETIKNLTEEITKEDIDVGLIGIGENAHIAFNDPPADFETKESYIIVTLDEKCRRQQVGEGWFPGIEDVPKQAISMTAYRIMQCKTIISAVPHAVKAEAIRLMIESKETTNSVPATLLKEHFDFYLFVDNNSAGTTL